MNTNTTSEHKKVAIITGVTNGIGRAASYLLPDLGYHTIYLVGRNTDKLETLKSDLSAQFAGLDFRTKVADLADFEQAHHLAEELKADTQQSGIDLFLNNAGVGQDVRVLNPQGYELNLATNYLSQVVLTEKLMGNLNQDSFTIFTSSIAYLQAKVDFENMNLESGFSMFRGYGNSKAYQMMYAKLLRNRVENNNPKNLHFEAVHPGGVNTGFGGTATTPLLKFFVKFLLPFALSPEKSAKNNVLAPIYTENKDKLNKADIWSNGKPVITKKGFMQLDQLNKLSDYNKTSLEKYL